MGGLLSVVQSPPAYCHYSAGPCDQSFKGFEHVDAFFAFASDPTHIAATVGAAVDELTRSKPNHRYVPWTKMQVGGQIIFCEICRSIRFAERFIADVTVLNFNVLFELGFALGLEKPIQLLRDDTYERDQDVFGKLGVIDTVGYDAYQKSDSIVEAVLSGSGRHLPLPKPNDEYRRAPLYVVLPHVETEGVATLKSSLGKSAFNYRSFDPKETARLSLTDIQRHVASSTAVVTPLLDPKRTGADVHNARCAFVAGMALARGVHVLMPQEGLFNQPIDYRDLVQLCPDSARVRSAVSKLVKQVAGALTSSSPVISHRSATSPLASLDLGDLAAENEDSALENYFIPTSQYQETARGRARLVVGRKGTGKSAIFSHLRYSYGRRAHDHLMVDLRPEGYQLSKLVDFLKGVPDRGTRQQISVTLWYFVFLSELSRAVLERDVNAAYRDSDTLALFEAVREQYEKHCEHDEDDFSDRLLVLVTRISESLTEGRQPLSTQQINESIWKGDLGPLTTALGNYLGEKKEVWLLVDNLDKGWPAHGATSHELLVLKGLLDASRKVEKAFRRSQVPIRTVVFVRNDIYEHLLSDTSDRGKESVVSLDHNDDQFLRNVIARRAAVSLEKKLSFEEFVQSFFELHVRDVETFRFLFQHTFGRARDAIRLTKRCIETAVNRGHSKVTESDILEAVRVHSNDVLRELIYEIRDSLGDASYAVHEFIGVETQQSRESLTELLDGFDSPEALLRMLIWYSFLGVVLPDGEEAYSYQEQYDVDRMLRLAEKRGVFVIHPAFRPALQ